jgi:hypothetical protein
LKAIVRGVLRRTELGRQVEFLLRRWRAGQRFRGQIPPSCRPPAAYAPYPPYHRGPNLEEYFYEYAKSRTFRRTYIPILWSTCYFTPAAAAIQPALLGLSPRGRYFVVCEPAFAPQEILPPDTLVFSAGGMYKGDCVPIPLSCSRLRDPIEVKSKDILCSFVGAKTHRIRSTLWKTYGDDPSFRFLVSDRWTAVVTQARLDEFVQISERSRFVLCPRGTGKTSFRLYEAMQLGSVPVYVSDVHHLPWADELDWNEICVLVKENEIPDLKERLLSIDGRQYQRMLENIQRLYAAYFDLESVCRNIEKRIA